MDQFQQTSKECSFGCSRSELFKYWNSMEKTLVAAASEIGQIVQTLKLLFSESTCKIPI